MSQPGPVVGVGGVLIRDGRVLLIRRAKQPLRGRWSIPGGTVELGEALEAALVREMEEETGLKVEPLELLSVFDRIDRQGERVRYHYVILDYLCSYVSGELRPGSDAREAAWAGRPELGSFRLPAKALEVIEAAFARLGLARGGPGGGIEQGLPSRAESGKLPKVVSRR